MSDKTFGGAAEAASSSAIGTVERVVENQLVHANARNAFSEIANFIASTQSTRDYESIKRDLANQKISQLEATTRNFSDVIKNLADSVSATEAKIVTAIKDYKGNDAAIAGQVALLADKLTSVGILDTGSFKDNLANLSVHFNGVRIDLVPLLMMIPLIRSYKNVVVRESHRSADPEDLKSLAYRDDHRTRFMVDVHHQRVSDVTAKVSIKPDLLIAYEAEEDLTGTPTRTGMRMVSSNKPSDVIASLTPFMDGLVYDAATDLITGTVKATKRVHLLQKELGEIATTIDLYTLGELTASIAAMGVNKYVGVLTALFSKDISKYFFGNGARGFLDISKR